MPPKRKAPETATATANEPPQTRRRTRSAATVAAEPPEIPIVDLPPLTKTRTRRTTKAVVEESTASSSKPVPRKPASTAKAPTSKAKASTSKTTTIAAPSATRTTARTRNTKAELVEDAQEEEAVVPKRRGRPAKAQSSHEPPVREVSAEPRQPLSPIPDSSSQTIPKKRGRPRKVAETSSATAPETTEPAARPRTTRTTRSRASQKDVPGSSSQSMKATTDEAHAAPTEENAPAQVRRRTRAKKAPSPVRRPVTPPPLADESSDDELLLTPSKKTAARLTTPMLTGEIRTGTPRLVMHSVEITTPRRLLNTGRRDLGSPGPKVHVPPLGTPRLPPAFPTASPHKVAPLTSRTRAARTPSPAPPEEPVRSPTKTSPSKRSPTKAGQELDDLPRVLPPRLHPLLECQKRAILKALQRPPEVDEIDVYSEDYPPTNRAAYEQLSDLLMGTVTRGEGNSCLLIGPTGSGKTQMVEQAIAALPGNPIVVRLSGYAQQNDRLAIREIAYQLAQQTGQSFLLTNEEKEEDEEPPDAAAPPRSTKDADDNPFLDPSLPGDSGPTLSVTLPPPAHLLALISMIPTLPRPTIVVLDGFDLFAAHARQALLYCLLDTAQACRAGPTTAASGMSSASGMAVIGVTARVDTINLLEKRVKSRFSGRMIRTAGAAKVGHWIAVTRAVLSVPLGERENAENEAVEEWSSIWKTATDQFLGNEAVLDALKETYALSRDYQMLTRILTGLALELSPKFPYPTAARLKAAISRQRCPSRFPPLHTLPYPAICLLIASVHAQTSGHDVFTFEMLHEAFKNQVRTSQSAPVQIEGGGIGMVRCSREVLFATFERLADLRIFVPAAAPGVTVGREFSLYRSLVDRFAVKKAVETVGQLSLKKWFTKAQ